MSNREWKKTEKGCKGKKIHEKEREIQGKRERERKRRHKREKKSKDREKIWGLRN